MAWPVNAQVGMGIVVLMVRSVCVCVVTVVVDIPRGTCAESRILTVSVSPCGRGPDVFTVMLMGMLFGLWTVVGVEIESIVIAKEPTVKWVVSVMLTCATSTDAIADQLPKIVFGSGSGIGTLKVIVATPLVSVVSLSVAMFVLLCIRIVNATGLLATGSPLEVTCAATETKSPGK